jgi:hypothetical protein
LLGTGAFAAAVLAGGGHQPAQAQTEGIRLLGEEESVAEALNGPVTIYVAEKVITLEAEQPEATAVAVVDGRISPDRPIVTWHRPARSSF